MALRELHHMWPRWPRSFTFLFCLEFCKGGGWGLAGWDWRCLVWNLTTVENVEKKRRSNEQQLAEHQWKMSVNCGDNMGSGRSLHCGQSMRSTGSLITCYCLIIHLFRKCHQVLNVTLWYTSPHSCAQTFTLAEFMVSWPYFMVMYQEIIYSARACKPLSTSPTLASFCSSEKTTWGQAVLSHSGSAFQTLISRASGLLLTLWLEGARAKQLFKEGPAGASNIGTDPRRCYTTAPVCLRQQDMCD